MADHALLMQALRNFATDMGRSFEIIDMSYRLAERVTEVLGVVGAGVCVSSSSGDLEFVAATSERMALMEQVQEENQEGPCVSAFRSQRPVLVNRIDNLTDWPQYGEMAKQLQLGAAVGYPLSYEGIRFGALDVYAAEPKQWSEDDLDVLGIFGQMATAYLMRAVELAETKELAKQLQRALDSRVLIEQAKGVLANEYGIGVDEAFQRLRRHSQRHNVKVVELCERVVTNGFKIPDEG